MRTTAAPNVRCIGRGNSGFADVDMTKTRVWVLLKHCTCDDDPYADACDFCLAERGVDVGYTDEEVLKIIQGSKNK